jgi:peptide chain release factor 3
LVALAPNQIPEILAIFPDKRYLSRIALRHPLQLYFPRGPTNSSPSLAIVSLSQGPLRARRSVWGHQVVIGDNHAVNKNRYMSQPANQKEVQIQAAKRRTFAIISHPDAGKTTLTEKLLLYSGMIHTAGMVRARKGGKATSSDWMALEQERGISISASAMQFAYKDAIINVLDTPGHQDFSEDTYRTLTAADSAVMVLDASKGVEAQTRKLFAVCKMQHTPILTFINKMDLPSKDPLELLQEVEDVLGILASPINWPIGSGSSFKGVVHVATREVTLFTRSEFGGSAKAIFDTMNLDQAVATGRISDEQFQQLSDELELLATAGNQFSEDKFLRGEITPVFFGSALTNFGIEPFFDAFTSLAPPPHPYQADAPNGDTLEINPGSEPFSAYVFKIQANMNPRHRDSMAYMRVCSGRFERDMVVKHHRSGKELRLSRSYSMVAQDRNTVDEAYPGDIIGVINPGAFAIGDTVSLRGGFNYKPMPQFPPEIVAQIRPTDVMRHKAFDKGILQLAYEGAVQILRSYKNPKDPPLVAAVGRLQFEVLQYRLQDEYGVKTAIDFLPYRHSVYVLGDIATLTLPMGSFIAVDARDRHVILLSAEWEKKYVREKNPNHEFKDFVQ